MTQEGSTLEPVRSREWLSPTAFDIALAAGVFVASAVNVSTQDAADGAAAPEIPLAGFAMLAIASVALYWRRSRSIAVLGAALVLAAAWMAFDFPNNPVFHILVSLYAVGRYVPGWRVNLGAVVGGVGVVGLAQVVDGDPASDLVTALVFVIAPWYLGRRIRLRRAAARERAEYLEWKRTNEAQRTIADARAGIARELHDVVAHNVSVMTVQAGVARLVVADDPQRAQEAIGAVEEAGRRALDELRHLLGVLRPEAASDELGPQPDLAQVHKLVEQLRRTGMGVTLDMEVSSGLPVRVALFAYRIIQEALTNVLKHAGVDAAAHVRVDQTDGRLEIEVTDNGAGASTLPGSGQGLVGMSERASLLGGTFEAGPRPEGGFRVLATLPIGDQ